MADKKRSLFEDSRGAVEGPRDPGDLSSLPAVGAAVKAPGREPARIWNLPNQLTIARLVLSVVFFVLLALETHGEIRQTIVPDRSRVLLNASIAVFLLAVITDFLDGYIARKWGLLSTFGRIADPFADKIVVCGGFIMLIGVAPKLVEPWFAVVIIFREFLVSGLRSFLESRGVAFGASLSGKLKMFVQSVTILTVLFHEANIAGGPHETTLTWAIPVTLLVLTLILTVTSSVGYVQRAIRLIRAEVAR
jgi:CDP-diacylglycerol--glycerol-3-phosphate 3-phosphatidyltransferase